jgi:peptide/nickel transport system substrate-binding protein
VRDFEYHLVEEVRAGRMTRRQLVTRASVMGLSVPAVSALLAACGSSSSSPSSGSSAAAGAVKRGGTGRFGITKPAQDVDPITMFNTGAIMTSQVAGEYLVFPRVDYSLEGRLATKWEPGSSPDTWTFTLRPNVKWHDGKPFTADDVIATFDKLTDPKVGSAALSAFSGVLSAGNVEKVDAQTVTFHLDRPFVDFPYLVSSFNYNSIILPKNYEIGQFTKGGVGTGPFILKSYSPGAGGGVKYVKNPNYWDPSLPYMDAVEIKYYDDTPPIVLALQGGAIDVFPQTPFQGSQALFSDSNITVLQSESSEYRYVHMRVDQEPFTDKRVRQAVAYCLDRPGLVQGLFGGRAQLGNDHPFAPVYPSSPQPGDIPQRAQDYDKAKSLLAAAGQSNLSITLETEQFLEIPQYAQFIQQQCKPAGINIKLQIEDQGTYYGSGKDQPWLQSTFGITDWGARGTASQTIGPAYLCRSVPKPDLSNSGAWNESHWCNEQYDKLVEQFDAELDQQKRHDIAVQAAKLQIEETPNVIGYWIKEQRTTRKNVHGLAAGPTFHLDPRRMWLST